jgi:hypothetical protein
MSIYQEIMFLVEERAIGIRMSSFRQIRELSKMECTACPKSPDAVLRGYISGTLGTTKMAEALKDAAQP